MKERRKECEGRKVKEGRKEGGKNVNEGRKNVNEGRKEGEGR